MRRAEVTRKQELVVHEAVGRIMELARSPWEPPAKPTRLQSLVPPLEDRRSNHVILIDGPRGSGKTTVLVTVLSILEKLLGVGSASGWATSENSAWSPLVIPLRPLDLTPLPSKTAILSFVLAQLRELDLGLEDAGSRPAWASASGRQVDHRWNTLTQSIAGYLGAGEQRLGHVDPLQFAAELDVAASERGRLVPAFRAYVDELIVDLQAEPALKLRAPPFLLLPIDDADMVPERCAELLQLLRNLSHPRLGFILTGESDLFERALRAHYLQVLWPQLRELPRDGAQPQQLVGPENYARRLAHEVYERTVPPPHRLMLAEPTLDEKLRLATPSGRTLRSLLELFVFDEAARAVPGTPALVTTLLHLLETEDVLPARMRRLVDIAAVLEKRLGTSQLEAHVAEAMAPEETGAARQLDRDDRFAAARSNGDAIAVAGRSDSLSDPTWALNELWKDAISAEHYGSSFEALRDRFDPAKRRLDLMNMKVAIQRQNFARLELATDAVATLCVPTATLVADRSTYPTFLLRPREVELLSVIEDAARLHWRDMAVLGTLLPPVGSAPFGFTELDLDFPNPLNFPWPVSNLGYHALVRRFSTGWQEAARRLDLLSADAGRIAAATFVYELFRSQIPDLESRPFVEGNWADIVNLLWNSGSRSVRQWVRRRLYLFALPETLGSHGEALAFALMRNGVASEGDFLQDRRSLVAKVAQSAFRSQSGEKISREDQHRVFVRVAQWAQTHFPSHPFAQELEEKSGKRHSTSTPSESPDRPSTPPVRTPPPADADPEAELMTLLESFKTEHSREAFTFRTPRNAAGYLDTDRRQDVVKRIKRADVDRVKPVFRSKALAELAERLRIFPTPRVVPTRGESVACGPRVRAWYAEFPADEKLEDICALIGRDIRIDDARQMDENEAALSHAWDFVGPVNDVPVYWPAPPFQASFDIELLRDAWNSILRALPVAAFSLDAIAVRFIDACWQILHQRTDPKLSLVRGGIVAERTVLESLLKELSQRGEEKVGRGPRWEAFQTFKRELFMFGAPESGLSEPLRTAILSAIPATTPSERKRRVETRQLLLERSGIEPMVFPDADAWALHIARRKARPKK